MKKNLMILSFLMVALAAGLVSGAIPGVGFDDPQPGANVSNTLIVNWTNTNYWNQISLSYSAGGCGLNPSTLQGGMDSSQTTYSWNTNGVNDGIYCLRLDQFTNETFSGNFTIDNTDPIAEANGPYSEIIYKPITFNSTGSSDGETGIVSYFWDFDDGTNGTGISPSHSYSSAETYTVTLTVTDYAGNTDSDTATVTINDLPTNPLTDQEVLADNTLNYTFPSGLTALISCSLMVSPGTGAVLTKAGNDCNLMWTPTNDQRGVHTTIIKVINGSDELYYEFTISVYSWMIPLSTGWNLFSIPLVPEDSSGDIDTGIGNVLRNIKSNIVYSSSYYTIYSYQFEGSENNWLKAKPSSSWSGDLDYIVPGHSYWVKMDQADVLKGFGDEYYAYNMPPQVALATNAFNLIGHYGLSSLVMNGTYALKSLEDNYMTSITTSNPQEGYWIWIKIVNSKESINYAPFYAL